MLLLPFESLQPPLAAFLTGSGRAVLSATAVGLLTGCTAKAGYYADRRHVEVGRRYPEHGPRPRGGHRRHRRRAESGLLQPPVLLAAVGFQSDQRWHAASGPRRSPLGGMVQSKTVAEQHSTSTPEEPDRCCACRRAGGGRGQRPCRRYPAFRRQDPGRGPAPRSWAQSMHWAISLRLGDQPPITVAFVGPSLPIAAGGRDTTLAPHHRKETLAPRACIGGLVLPFCSGSARGAPRAIPLEGEQIYHRCQGCHSIDRIASSFNKARSVVRSAASRV